ncbi:MULTISPECIES: hypothetical protein [unclassified Mesorhizobium]|uniref:hypothetical protein n=1 Tax=unclassified Mesorhizobium TaxID=325217 RepID=UPI0012EBC53C|nr:MULTISPECIES: hypothetical protein [unclassified Mesorhizobium]WJI78957.1 hypothetical protein NLY34_18960 [Mesorhizobium sp. C374B]WJI85491.1 hypothetical protein NLY42_21360 [Mesorhizobium sp. C372A]
MAIFLIVPQPHTSGHKLGPAIAANFPNANYALEGEAGWLVSANLSVMDLSGRLGITDGSNGAAVIVEAASYYGRANPNTWSWIKANWDSTKNG